MQRNNYKYVFSIVMAVYNCEPFLRETLDSIVNQDITELCRYENGKKTDARISFEEAVQVIMVDDGSKDSSGSICDEYAAKFPNFEVIHKENGGVASARNAGLERVEGKYMNFLDSDDKFTPNVLATMYDFFERNYEKTDVITMPLQFFDATSGAHWQNYKFKEISRVVDLFNEYDSPLMFVNASFFKSEYKDKVRFDGRLVCGEDIKYICEILSHRMTLGLVSDCSYMYRRRSSGEESLVQSSKKKRGWYFDYFTALVHWGVDFCKAKWGYIPYYFQNILVCDLQWRFSNDYEDDALKILSAEEYEKYKDILYSSLSDFDDEIILHQRFLWIEHKCMMLIKKHGSLPEKCIYDDDVRLRFGNTLLCWLSTCTTKLDFVKIENGHLTVEGVSKILGYPDDTPVSVYVSVKNGDSEPVLCPCEITDRDVNSYRLGEILFRGVAFKASVPTSDISDAEIKIVTSVDGQNIVKKDLRFGFFCPVSADYENGYYYNDGYALQARNDGFRLFACTKKEKRKLEREFIRELRGSSKLGAKKAALARFITAIYKKLHKKPLWIISDRTNKAGDNGEAFFRHLKSTGFKRANYVYAIEKGSADYARLKSIKGVIDRNSKKYKMLYLAATHIISSHADASVLDPFIGYNNAYRDMLSNKKFIFLQHGITQNDISGWLNRFNKNIYGFICSAEREARSIIEGNYHYDESRVWLTGMPRFDRLYDNPKKYITLMPTWRRYLANMTDVQSGVWRVIPGFTSSEYFKFYNALINDERVLRACKENGYTLCFMPHPNIINDVNLFDKNKDVIFFDISKEYRDIYAESSLILTDYSSAVFDFAYMRKPVLYAHFDKSTFFAGDHVCTEGYFDYEQDGFGEVSYNYEDTVAHLISYIENDCKLGDKYRERINSFFAFNDRENCSRIVDRILNP